MLLGELLGQVDSRLERGDPEGALDMLQQALALYPVAWPLRRALAITLARMDHREEALTAAKRALELQPEDPQLWRIVGQLSEEHSQEEAARAFRNALLFEPANHELQETLLALGREADLHSDLRLGWLHLFQGMVDIARAELKEAEHEDPLMARLGLLKAALASENLPMAAKVAATLLEVYPQLLPALVVLTIDARERGDAAGFQQWLRELREVDPDGTETAASMTELLRHHPLPEMAGLRVDVPIQEPLAKEDLEALEELDEQLSVELMLLATPEGQGVAPPEELDLPDAGSSEMADRALAGENIMQLQEVPAEADLTAIPAEPGAGQVLSQRQQVEAELATVDELLAQVRVEEPPSRAKEPVSADGLVQLVAQADGLELEHVLEAIRSAQDVDREIRHRLLALTYRKMGLGLESLGEVLISLRYRPRKRA